MESYSYENQHGHYESYTKTPPKSRAQHTSYDKRDSHYFTSGQQRSEDFHSPLKTHESSVNKSFQSQNMENAQLKRLLPMEIRINLGAYAIEKIISKLKMKAVWNGIKEARSRGQAKVFKSVSPHKVTNKGRVMDSQGNNIGKKGVIYVYIRAPR